MGGDGIDGAVEGAGDSAEGVAGHGGGSGCMGGCEVAATGSGAGASGISSTLGEDAFGLATGASGASATSFISTSSVGATGADFGLETSALPFEPVESAIGMSFCATGETGDDFADATSSSAGELISTFTDRLRSRCNLSDTASFRSRLLNDKGSFISLFLFNGVAGAFIRDTGSVCVELST